MRRPRSGRLDLDDVRRPGHVYRRPGSDHDAVARLDETALPGGLERACPEILHVLALSDRRGDHAPFEGKLLDRMSLVRNRHDRALWAVTCNGRGGSAAVGGHQDGDGAENLGDVAGGV